MERSRQRHRSRPSFDRLAAAAATRTTIPNGNLSLTIIVFMKQIPLTGIPKASSYKTVKNRFIELALQYHPDVATNDNKNISDDDNAGDDNVETFVRLRIAFEAIREAADGSSRLEQDDDSSSWSDEEFRAWFYEETGHQDVMFRMDLQTRKEVVDIVKSDQAQGGLDKGGMWEMARAMAQQEESLLAKNNKNNKSKGENEAFKGIDSGATPQPSVRRRRGKG
jgi:curved DNA-binding protein CbpA